MLVEGDSSPSAVFEIAGERFDVAASHGEQASSAVVAPLGELAEIECVGVSGQTGMSAEEACERSQFGVGEHVVAEVVELVM